MPFRAIYDERMFDLIEDLKLKGRIRFIKQFSDVIGIGNTNYLQIKEGKASFTARQIYRAGKEYGVNMNWLFGLDRKMYV